MPTKRRDYLPLVPVAVTARWVFRLRLFEQEELRKLLQKLVVIHAAHCRVTVLAWSIRSTHLHMILVEPERDEDDWDLARRGIAPFMRNVLSHLALHANQMLGHEGHITERRYRGHKLETLGDLLRQLAYVLGQEEHHTGRIPQPLTDLAEALDSRPVTFDGLVDGLVTHRVDFPGLEPPASASTAEHAAALAAILQRIIHDAIALERLREQDAAPDRPNLTPEDRYRTKHPWRTAVRELGIGVDFPIDIDAPVRAAGLLAIAGSADAKRHEALRQLHLRYVPPEYETSPRPPAHIGDVIEIEVRRVEPDAPPPPAPAGP